MGLKRVFFFFTLKVVRVVVLIFRNLIPKSVFAAQMIDLGLPQIVQNLKAQAWSDEVTIYLFYLKCCLIHLSWLSCLANLNVLLPANSFLMPLFSMDKWQMRTGIKKKGCKKWSMYLSLWGLERVHLMWTVWLCVSSFCHWIKILWLLNMYLFIWLWNFNFKFNQTTITRCAQSNYDR